MEERHWRTETELEAAAAAAEQGKGGRVNVVADAEEVGFAVNDCMQIYADVRTYVHTYIHTCTCTNNIMYGRRGSYISSYMVDKIERHTVDVSNAF